jgi:hypothetical protein
MRCLVCAGMRMVKCQSDLGCCIPVSIRDDVLAAVREKMAGRTTMRRIQKQ